MRGAARGGTLRKLGATCLGEGRHIGTEAMRFVRLTRRWRWARALSDTRRMGWATGHIAKPKAGETVSFRPRGDSMLPKIHSGGLCQGGVQGDPGSDRGTVSC